MYAPASSFDVGLPRILHPYDVEQYIDASGKMSIEI
jgi:hypothetical protein